MGCGVYFQVTIIVEEGLAVPIVGIDEVLLVMLVLKGDESVAYEMGQVEEETIIGGVLVVQNNRTVVDELYLLGNCRETRVLLLPLAHLLYKPVVLALFLQILTHQFTPGLVQYLQPVEVIAEGNRPNYLVRLQLSLVVVQQFQQVIFVGVICVPFTSLLHPFLDLRLEELL